MFFGDSVERFMNSHPIFNKIESKNKFGQMSSPSSANNFYDDLNDYKNLMYIQNTDVSIQLIQYVFIVIAIYLALKCKKNGDVNFIQIILAVLFAPLYILFRIIKPCI